MKIEHLFAGIKGMTFLKKLGYTLLMKHPTVEKREEILLFYKKHGISATLDAYAISRSTLFRWQAAKENLQPKSTRPKHVRKSSVDPRIVHEIKTLRIHHRNICKEKIYALLDSFCKTYGLNRPSVSTIGRIIAAAPDKMRIAPDRINRDGKQVKIKQRVFKDRKPKNMELEPFKVIATDTIEYRCASKKRYILTFIDPYSRMAFAVALPSKQTRYTAVALKALINGIKKPFSILSDNGSEFAKDFAQLAREHGVKQYFTYPRCPKMNAHCERFNRTLKESFANYYTDLLFEDLHAFNALLAQWIVEYNTVLPHSSLGYKTPLDFLMDLDKKSNGESQMYWTNTKA